MREPSTIKVDREKKKRVVRKVKSLGITYEAFVDRLHDKALEWTPEQIFKIMTLAAIIMVLPNIKNDKEK